MIQVRTLKLHYNGDMLRLPGDIYELDEAEVIATEDTGAIETVEKGIDSTISLD